MNYRKDIQILRGVAVFLVVLYHLGFAGFNSGFLGVDVFFVISGFLMSVLYDKNKKIEFYRKRAVRLLPAYFVTIIVTLIASIFIVTPNEYKQVFNQSLYADFLASNVGYWMQNSYFSKAEFNPLLHLWSLGVEIQYYLLIPILFYFLKINRYFFWLIFIVSISLCFIIVLVSTKTSFFMMPLRIWEFLIGYGVAKYLTVNGAIVKKQYSWLGSFFLFVIIAIPILNVNGESLSFISGHPGIYALFIALSTGIVLSVGINKAINNSTVGTFLEIMGKYSYSIYLVHFPVIVLFLYKPFSGTKLQANNTNELIGLVIIIISLSYIMYHLVENKLRKSKYINIFLVVTPFIVLGIAFSGFYAQKKSFTHKEMLIFNAFQDRSTYRCGKIFRVMNPASITCKITSSDTPTKQNVLLVGNSHADSIKSTFANAASAMNSSLFFLVPNDPLMESSNITSERIINEALNFNVKSIILHYSPKASINVSTIRKIVELANNKNIFVAFIMPVPTWDRHIPRALWENEKYNKELPIQTLNDYNQKTKKLHDSLKEIKLDNFIIYPVSTYFCDENCSFVENTGKPLYFDTGHLTLTGSGRLLSLFKSIISDGLAIKN